VPSFGILYQVTDIPRGKIAGSDLELQWQPTRADSVHAELSYLYSDTGPFSLPTGIQSATGHPYINAPKWTFNFDYGHDFVFGAWRLEPKVATHVVSSYNTDFRFTETTRQGSYSKTDVNLTFGPINDRWYVNAYVRNVEDKVVIVSAQAAPGRPPPQFWGFLSDPRTYGLRAGVKF
jgi:iron complex outermembrane receptor protein